MSDLLKGLTGGWAAFYAWIFPSALALGAFWLFVFPQMDASVREHFGALLGTQQGVIFVAGSAALGLTLNALSTPLYRVLEGYYWPRTWSQHYVQKERERKLRLQTEYDRLQNEFKNDPSGCGWILGLKFEELARFPLEDSQIAPTRLGNALRAFETYGSARFNLDSQSFWQELCSVVPKYLQDELDRSRGNVDLFVALFYLSALLGLTSFTVFVSEEVGPGVLVAAIAAFGSMFLWYRMAVVSTSYQAVTVRALVNTGRVKLAEALGLQIPTSIDEEREMWRLAGSLVAYGYSGDAQDLDRYRKQQGSMDSTALGESKGHAEAEEADADEGQSDEDADNGEQ